MSADAPGTDADLILVGAGLANGLIALRLLASRPSLRLLMIEAGPTLGGNHTWSFHDSDLDAAQRAWVEPLVCWRWSGHEVRFPQRTRRLDGGYASVSSERFHAVLRERFGPGVHTGTAATIESPTSVRLPGGRVLNAGAVIDARGLPPLSHLQLGWQVFLGQVLRLRRPHGLDAPILMDATVPQHGGYRFVYTLPLDAMTLLVEDTLYADQPGLDDALLRARIGQYASAQGWQPAEVLREERGVLPIALDGDPQALWRSASGVPTAGLAAALFHPTTGYSLPEAARLADVVAAQEDLRAPALFEAMRSHALRRWKAQGFFRLLNRMLFRAAAPAERWRVMQRFYGLPEPLIARFYAGRLMPRDKLRILTGRPPVPLGAAMRAAFPTRAAPPVGARP